MVRPSAIALATLLTACAGSTFSSESSKDSGVTGNGGATSTGAQTGSGGAGAGGSQNGGNAGVQDGGASAGGATGSGGRVGNGGGNTGGLVGSGGVANTGGISAGGTKSTGGTMNTGGIANTGGVSTGGIASTGGTKNTGGMANTGGSGNVTSTCPPDPPISSAGVPCKDGLVCSYGSDSRISCRNVYTCQGSTWGGASTACPAVPSCLDMAPAPQVGAACQTPGAYCEFSGGLTCGCELCSSTSCSAPYEWTCLPPPSSPCPQVPPNEGQPCDPQSTSQCSYAFCGVPEFVIATCSSKTWAWLLPPCAVAVP